MIELQLIFCWSKQELMQEGWNRWKHTPNGWTKSPLVWSSWERRECTTTLNVFAFLASPYLSSKLSQKSPTLARCAPLFKPKKLKNKRTVDIGNRQNKNWTHYEFYILNYYFEHLNTVYIYLNLYLFKSASHLNLYMKKKILD